MVNDATPTQVSAAVDALGGAAESLDPLTLMIASGVGEARSGWSKSGMDGIAIRVQYSNGIPIQVTQVDVRGQLDKRQLCEIVITPKHSLGGEHVSCRRTSVAVCFVRAPSTMRDRGSVLLFSTIE